MLHNHRRKSIGLGAALVTAALMSAGTTTALATSAEPDETLVEVVEMPMQIVGYDEAVAEANGFRIIVDEHGNEQSVPVTDEARATVAAYDWSVAAPSDGMSTMDVAWDTCGSSALYITRSGPNHIDVETAYSVYTTSVRHFWAVSGATDAGTYYENFDGWNASNTWHAVHPVYVGSNDEGWGQVVAGSRAFLTNGAICWSGQPYDAL